MSISNLEFWLSSVLSLLINISQETILDFFDIESGFTNNEYSELVGPITTPVSSQTFKIIIRSIWRHYKHGLGFVDIENIAIFILVLRFIFLSKKYNIKTGFLITCFGLGAAYLWYMHLRDLAYFYMRSLWLCPLTHNLARDFTEIYTQQMSEYSKAGLRFDSRTFYGPAIRALTDMTNNGSYRYDPISMIWAHLPDDIKYTTDKIYYFLTLKVIPQTYRFIDTQITNLSSTVWYTFIVRINKRFCPYLIRWHWTFLLGLDFIERPFIYAQFRLLYYLNEVLIPDGYFREAELVASLLVTIVASQYIFILLGLLHALCGQYFYFPFFTENTELHVGLRPKDSIYSGGHTIWQNKRAYMMTKQSSSRLKKYRIGTIRAAYSKLPRFWYGWLGRGTLDDLTTDEYKKYLKNKENKDSIKKARRRNSKIRWGYRQERLKKRVIQLLAIFGIKISDTGKNDRGDDLYDEFKKFTKK
jgi:hypothetical protein